MGSPRQMFKKKILAASIAACASVSYSAIAQNGAPVEEVLVTGIRASLENAMDIKRESSGVVDAISAEDIGKMPDANLAESLQRIAGVSISRTNGEGSKVTVRGIDPNLNMVTLNGRLMPTVTNDGTSGDKSSRAYDFANLASESVTGVEVYKTGNAANNGGGLGASINLKTLKPLDAGERLILGAKAVQDTTVYRGDEGSEFTPELSGLYSWVNDEENFGISLNAAYQERDSVRSNAFVNNWQLKRAGAPTFAKDENGNNTTEQLTTDGTLPVGATITNAPQEGQLYALPTDLRYVLEEGHRERTNSQLTVQFRPVETLTATLDYTFSKNDVSAERAQQSTWYNINRISAATFDTGNAVATPLIYREAYPDGGKDVSFALQQFQSVSQNNSLGLNLAWDVNDRLTMEFDFHDSIAKNETFRPEMGLNANIVTSEYSNWSQDLPGMGITFDDSDPAKGNNNGIIDGGDVSGAIGTIAEDFQRAEVQQMQLKGNFDIGQFAFFEESKLDFGLSATDTSNFSLVKRGESPRITMGNWGGVDPDSFGSNWPNYFTARNFGEGFDQSGTTGDSEFLSMGLQGDYNSVKDALEYANALAQTRIRINGDDPTTVDDPLTLDDPATPEIENRENFEEYYYVTALDPNGEHWLNRDNNLNPDNFNNFPDGKFKVNSFVDIDRTISEEINSLYVAFGGGFEINGMAANLGVGLRYEETKLTSTSIVTAPSNLQWDGDNDWSAVPGEVVTIVSEKNSYDNVLPNIDFDINITEDIKLRASYSTTMARPSYSQLKSDVSVDNIYLRQSSGGNPSLVALESDNFDISAEWYYDEGSYASLAIFTKDVSNFIGTGVSKQAAYGLRDHRAGPRAQAAINSGVNPQDEEAFWQSVCGGSPCVALAEDPILLWDQSLPTNREDASIEGIELSVQHWFADTGFGVQANYTMVDSDLEFDDTSTDEQFGLIGLSDTANLVGMYENYGFQARLAYNWRDEFLSSTNQGGSNAPGYTEAFAQIDFSLGYEINENVSVSLEGLNITGEDSRVRGRAKAQMFNFEDLGARYAAGIRVSF